MSEDEKVAGNSFRSLIQSMHKLGYTCSRLDYVCHSMGGSMVRDAITRYPLSYYGKSKLQSRILSQDHYTWYATQWSSLCKSFEDIDNDGYSFVIQPVLESQNLFEKVNFNTYRIVPAVADLRFESGVHFKESEVKSHLIFGSLPCVGFNVTTLAY
ncbi:MAG: hypothetical protein IPL98_14955 [Saprospiraceae bacterium]|nr:hypothetical protein [Saprospiraceae bacterium]